ncbi:MAG: pentapeptide repeat-containing protein [Candidatus Nitrosomaritimum aestuariumsis]
MGCSSSSLTGLSLTGSSTGSSLTGSSLTGSSLTGSSLTGSSAGSSLTGSSAGSCGPLPKTEPIISTSSVPEGNVIPRVREVALVSISE